MIDTTSFFSDTAMGWVSPAVQLIFKEQRMRSINLNVIPEVLLAPGILLSGLIAFQLFEAYTCFKRQTPEVQKHYNWGRVVLKKGGTWMLWVGFLWLDGIAKTIPGLIDGCRLPLLCSRYVFPITTGFTLLAGASEWYRYATNVGSIQGSSTDAVWAFRFFRLVTAGGIQKWIGNGNIGVMPTRAMDGITLKNIEEAIEYYNSEGKLPVPEWMRKIAPDHVPTLEELENLTFPVEQLETIRKDGET